MLLDDSHRSPGPLDVPPYLDTSGECLKSHQSLQLSGTSLLCLVSSDVCLICKEEKLIKIVDERDQILSALNPRLRHPRLKGTEK